MLRGNKENTILIYSYYSIFPISIALIYFRIKNNKKLKGEDSKLIEAYPLLCITGCIFKIYIKTQLKIILSVNEQFLIHILF